MRAPCHVMAWATEAAGSCLDGLGAQGPGWARTGEGAADAMGKGQAAQKGWMDGRTRHWRRGTAAGWLAARGLGPQGVRPGWTAADG